MTSPRKLAANRANARKSTGPKTAGGRTRAARNAFRHGLSVAMDGETIQSIADTIAGPGATAELKAIAWRIAEAHVDLLRVRLTRHRILLRVLMNISYNPANPRVRSKLVGDLLAGRIDGQTFEDRAVAIPTLAPSERLVAALQDRDHGFAALERYERRAFSRRASAVRAFDTARAGMTPGVLDRGTPLPSTATGNARGEYRALLNHDNCQISRPLLDLQGAAFACA